MTFDPSAMPVDPFKLGVLAALDDPEVARASAMKLAAHMPIPDTAITSGWLDARGAANHLGLTLNALYKLTSAGRIPFHQDCRNGKLWFLPSELDDWRRGGDAGRFQSASKARGNRS